MLDPVLAERIKGLFSAPAVPAPPPLPPIRLQSTERTTVASDGMTAATPALWNPSAVQAWSLPFTWAFGSILLAKNWQALGNPARAQRCMLWFYSAVAFLLLAFVTPNSPEIASAFRMVGLFILIVWVYAEARPQIKYVQEKFGNEYQRRSWGKPLGIGMACLALPVLLLVVPETGPGTSGSANKLLVLGSWLGMINQAVGCDLQIEQVQDIEYQIVHRSASVFRL